MVTYSLKKSNPNFVGERAKNVVAGLAVSFVAISLGVAFEILSERGAFSGILSAAIIALITVLFGSTRIQTSGPTAPMTAIMVLITAYAAATRQCQGSGLLEAIPAADPARFINLVLVLCGVILVIAAVTLMNDLITAVIVFTALFYLTRLKFNVLDLESVETVVVVVED